MYLPTESLYHLLLDLSTVPVHLSSEQLEVNLTSLACACLLSLVVARGDTSEILGAVAGLLMSPSSLATQMVEVSRPVTVERSGSWVELRTLDYENPGSNPGCGVETLGKCFTLHCSSSLSCIN